MARVREDVRSPSGAAVLVRGEGRCARGTEGFAGVDESVREVLNFPDFAWRRLARGGWETSIVLIPRVRGGGFDWPLLEWSGESWAFGSPSSERTVRTEGPEARSTVGTAP